MKLADWETKLSLYLINTRAIHFSYDFGAGLDCCTFAFGAIHAQTGLDIGREFAGRYTTRKQSLQLMAEYCGKPSLYLFISKLMKEHGFESTHPNFASRGDIILCRNALGVIDLNGRDVVCMTEQGLYRMPQSIRCKCWRVA